MSDDIDRHRITPLMRLLLAAVTVTVLLLALFYWQSTNRADRLERQASALAAASAARSEVIEDLAAGQQSLREQLLAEGIEPDVPAPSQTIREIIRETGATGATGATGSQGIQGVAGRDGRDGITPACWFEQSQCVGEQGPAGEDGADGVDGQDGADSTVPGPQGPAGQDGADGQDGIDGQDGQDGVDGQDGAPGPACPPGYEPRVIENGPQSGWIACAPVG